MSRILSRVVDVRAGRAGMLLRAACASLLMAGLGGCALFGAGDPQQVEVHAFLGRREVAGVGCMLANDVGRWTVVAPGRVTIQRSRTPLSVDCQRPGTGSLAEQIEAPAELGHLDAHLRIGAESGYYVNGGIGLAYAYPATLSIPLRGPGQADRASAVGSPVF